MSSDTRTLTRVAGLAIAAAIVTMALKFLAYRLTGSVGLLSDAIESSANLVAALTALGAVWYAARPVDRDHPYGHHKVEYFAAGIEGTLIAVAGLLIMRESYHRWQSPRAVEDIGWGLGLAMVATIINLVVARVLLRVARRHRSITLEADGKHLMTDVLTSAGVVVALVLAKVTGMDRIDPVVAAVIALNVLWTGVHLMRVSIDGLMDRALPVEDVTRVREAIEAELEAGENYHALRTRRAGALRFVDFHLLVPGDVSVSAAHTATHRLEKAVGHVLPFAETTVHIEPIEEPASWQDSALD